MGDAPMWIGICEDEAEYRNRLEKEVRSIARATDRITVYANGSELLDDICAAAIPMDMLLLDIEMPAISGIETAVELQKTSPETQIIIITKHTDFALKSFAVRPSNYLVKPVAKSLLKAEIDRARRIAGEVIGETLYIRAKEIVAFVPLKEIRYIECFKETLHIHTADTVYKYNQKLGTIVNELADKGFCRIHKSIVVNLRYVVNFDRVNKIAVLSAGESLPVSELRITGALADYAQYWQSLVPKMPHSS
jgi:DNA-binding LytR/AlgR family response regulator